MPLDTKNFFPKEYDLLVIGGGINGAAIANLAAGSGRKVVLLEKGDFASGTSTKTTKLIHGGLRYLENFQFDLVYEALHERTIQIKNVPYLVKPLRFIIPVYKDDPRPLWMMRLGVWLYNALSGRHNIGRPSSLKPHNVLKEVPGLGADGLAGGVVYYDAQMDDARLCLENILEARCKGAHVANYVEVVSFLKKIGKTIGVVARDIFSAKEFQIYAKKIVCAVGPWSNSLLALDNPNTKPRVRATKGVHLVYRGQIARDGLLVQTKKDNRFFFILPWKGNSLIGTTDTDYFGSPDEVPTKPDDIDYLFREAARVFPRIPFKKENIITTFAGLRPLIYEQGAPSQVSRRHLIFESYSGVYFVMGGKYTTYRRIAMDCLNKIYPKKFIFERESYPLYGSGDLEENSAEIAKKYNLDSETVEGLKNTYGVRYKDVLKLIGEDPLWCERICPCSPVIAAQVIYAFRTEMACRPDDVFWRRLSLVYQNCPTRQCYAKIEQIFQQLSKKA